MFGWYKTTTFGMFWRMSGLSNFTTSCKSWLFLYLLNFDCLVDIRQHLVGFEGYYWGSIRQNMMTNEILKIILNIPLHVSPKFWLFGWCKTTFGRFWRMSGLSNFTTSCESWIFLYLLNFDCFVDVRRQHLVGFEGCLDYPISQLVANLDYSSIS